eukprot:TRINITY_DN9293_c1_g2_i1.p1 TRINITY_DN9293_c1_g2~~TRINITY_DN9293_c1_g2_i1.p1  ORF type:complete len:388 (+),score=106.71 TRINITY_DN9293_c1_g2_i1:2-1165(+)
MDATAGAAGRSGDEEKPKLTRISSVNRRILESEEDLLWQNLNTFATEEPVTPTPTDTDTITTAPTPTDTTTASTPNKSTLVVEDLDDNGNEEGSDDDSGSGSDSDDGDVGMVPQTEKSPATVSRDSPTLTAEDLIIIDKLGSGFDGIPVTKEECRKLVSDMYLSCNRNESETRRLLQAARASFDAELQHDNGDNKHRQQQSTSSSSSSSSDKHDDHVSGVDDEDGDEDEDDEDGEDFFVCDRCDRECELTDKVWHCQSCEDFDLCDDCMSVQRTTPFHQRAHTFTLQQQPQPLQPQQDQHNTKLDQHPPPTHEHVHAERPMTPDPTVPQQPSQRPHVPPPPSTQEQKQQHTPATSSTGASPVLVGALIIGAAAVVGWYLFSKRSSQA